MAKLPFIVEPKSKPVLMKIGNDEIGIFEIERRGYLTVSEKTFVDSFTQSSGILKDIVKISNQVSLSMKMGRDEAYNLVVRVLSGNTETKNEKAVAEKFEVEIAEMTSNMADMQSKRALAVATILLQSRVDSEWEFQDTLTLEPQIVEELCSLYDLEESKVKPEQPETPAQEILGK